MGETRSKFRDVVKMVNVIRSKEGEVEEIWQELKETLRKASDVVSGRILVEKNREDRGDGGGCETSTQAKEASV